MLDPDTGAERRVPPSIPVLGVYGQSDRISDAPWFSPSGYNRGVPNVIASNDPADQTSLLLERPDLDKLYDADINPIAVFKTTGLAVWGQ